jgi:hypothetical protein
MDQLQRAEVARSADRSSVETDAQEQLNALRDARVLSAVCVCACLSDRVRADKAEIAALQAELASVRAGATGATSVAVSAAAGDMAELQRLLSAASTARLMPGVWVCAC